MLNNFLNENKKVAVIVGVSLRVTVEKLISAIKEIKLINPEFSVYFADSTVPHFDYSYEKSLKIIQNGLTLRTLSPDPILFFRDSAYSAIRKDSHVGLVIISDVDSIEEKDLGLNEYQKNNFFHLKI